LVVVLFAARPGWDVVMMNSGVFIAGFLFVPGLGVQRSLWLTALVNLAIGLVAILVSQRTSVPRPLPASSPAPGEPTRDGGSWTGRLILVVFALSGFAALVLEVAWTRVLALVLGSSVYAFTLMLLAFLVGLALGGAVFSRYLRRGPRRDPARLLVALLVCSGLTAYASTWMFQLLPRLFAEILFRWDTLGPSGWFFVQFGLSLLVMFPTTFALGGIFPAVLQLHARDLAQVSGSVGTVYASNTVGTILGAAMAGFVLIPAIGSLTTVVSVSLAQVLLAGGVALALVVAGRGARRAVALIAVGLVVVLFAARPGWDVVMMNSGVFNLYGRTQGTSWEEFWADIEPAEVIYEAEGLTANVFVAYEEQYDNLFLTVNGKVEASTQSDLETQLLIAHLPLLFHPDAKDVLVIGLASGITVGSVGTHNVENVRVLEIERAMLDAARLFSEHNYYDVIISEPSNPWMTVAANLFTEDFFRTARARVRPDGIYCQWIQNYYLDPEDLRAIIAAFQKSFPNIMIFETYEGVDLVMLGSQEPLGIDLAELDERMADLPIRMDFASVGIADGIDLISKFRLGDREVRRMVEGAPRNTDDNARVEFSSPKSLGRTTIPENVAMLRRFGSNPLDYLSPSVVDPEVRDRILLDLAEVWLLDGNYDLADPTARLALGGPHAARAERLLARLEAADEGS
jgi:spermidine synthase